MIWQEGIGEGLPKNFTAFGGDFSFPGRLAAHIAKNSVKATLVALLAVAQQTEMSLEFSKEKHALDLELKLTELGGTVDLVKDIKQLERMIRDISSQESQLQSLIGEMQQAGGAVCGGDPRRKTSRY